jgi:hypothetical protein
VNVDPSSERDLYSVKIDMRGTAPPSQPEKLFDAEALGLRVISTGARAYDVGPDGQRFVVATSRVQGEGVLTLVQNIGAWLRQSR